MVDPRVRCVIVSCRLLLVVVEGEENISSSSTNPLPDVALVVVVSRHPRLTGRLRLRGGGGPMTSSFPKKGRFHRLRFKCDDRGVRALAADPAGN